MSGTTRTRSEHLQWTKDRAIEYLDAGDKPQAFASFFSDTSKHPGLADHPMLQFMQLMMFGDQSIQEVRDHIEGYN